MARIIDVAEKKKNQAVAPQAAGLKPAPARKAAAKAQAATPAVASKAVAQKAAVQKSSTKTSATKAVAIPSAPAKAEASAKPRTAARPRSRPGAVEIAAHTVPETPAPAAPSPEAPPQKPMVIWAISDGRAGIEAQAVGLAEAVGRQVPATIEVKRVEWRGKTGRLPWWANWLPRHWLTPESGVQPPWPDLWIAAGRATLPLSIRARRWSGGRTYVVQIQDPRVPANMFDLVIPPKHDRLTGDNVLPITGSPHRVTSQRLDSEYAKFKDQIEALPRPRVAVLLGGKSRAFDLSPVRAAEMAHQIQLPLEQEGGSLLMTFSRRTPEAAKALLTARLRHLPGIIWDGEGANPYFAFLAAADYILVTEDSTNMATEAASTGKPVFILKMDGTSLKFRLFHQELEGMGAARPYGGAFHGWTYEPVDETGRAAAEIVARMQAGGGTSV
jgi:uncharacterized protein